MTPTPLSVKLDNLSSIVHKITHTPSQIEQFHALLARRSPELHYAISVTRSQASLNSFALDYIRQLPAVLTAIAFIAGQNELDGLLYPIIDELTAIVIYEEGEPENETTIVDLLTRAYIVYRLIEELNDDFALHHKLPLLPNDYSTTNLIVHDIIGEPFANELDASAQQRAAAWITASAAFSMAFIDETQIRASWNTAFQRWPELDKDLGLTLSFANQHIRHQ